MPALIDNVNSARIASMMRQHGLPDAREETFARMVCDGLPMGECYKRAGFSAKSETVVAASAYKLLHQIRIQDRINEILEKRKTLNVVTLPQVTDMLTRVYASALHAGDHGPAHAAAFSLARLYGLVIERQQVEVLRKPSRNPDAPAEVELGQWVAQALPQGSGLEALNSHSGLEALNSHSGLEALNQAANSGSGLQALNEALNSGSVLEALNVNSGSGLEALNLNSGLGSEVSEHRGRPENGAPVRAVTGTPHSGALAATAGAHAEPLIQHDTKPVIKTSKFNKLRPAKEVLAMRKQAAEQRRREGGGNKKPPPKPKRVPGPRKNTRRTGKPGALRYPPPEEIF